MTIYTKRSPDRLKKNNGTLQNPSMTTGLRIVKIGYEPSIS
jgi:hypothetical protein